MITTKALIKFLPLDEDFRKNLLEEYDALDPDRKSLIIDHIWNAYYDYYQNRLELNLQLAFEKAKKGEEILDAGLHQRVAEKTQSGIDIEVAKYSDEAGMDEARKAREMIIKEMKAANMIGKTPAQKAN